MGRTSPCTTHFGCSSPEQQVQQGDSDCQFKIAWFEEMVSAGVVRHNRALPPHAGGEIVARGGSPNTSTGRAATGCASTKSNDAGNNPYESSVEERPSVPRRPAAGWLRIPLRECARSNNDDGSQARSLLDAGAATEDTDRAGRTALHWAAARGNVSVVHALLDAGADCGARDGAGSSPLHCAARSGHVAVVEALLDWSGTTREGCWPSAALSAECASKTETLSSGFVQARGADGKTIVDARNAYGSTSLHRAAFNGREDVVTALLKHGAGVSVLGRSGRTALHLACRNVHPGCVETLLAAGAFESATAKDGSTPWSELTSAAEERRPGDPKVAGVAFALRRAHGRRAWGRRGWLVMLKAAWDRRDDHVSTRDTRGATTIRTLGSSQGRENFERVVAGCGWTRRAFLGGVFDDDDDDDDVSDDAVCESGGELSGGNTEMVEDLELESVVSRLLDVGEGGAFRLVVSFL